MIRVALKGLLGRKLRAILTAFAIVLGVAMISGSFVLTDTLGKSLDGVYQESYKGTDAVISSKHKVQQADGTTEKAPFSADVLTDIGHVAGVRAVQGSIEDHISLVDKAGKRIGKPDDGIAVAVSNPDDRIAQSRQGRRRHVADAAATRSRSTGRPRPSSTSRSARRSARSVTARSSGIGSAD